MTRQLGDRARRRSPFDAFARRWAMVRYPKIKHAHIVSSEPARESGANESRAARHGDLARDQTFCHRTSLDLREQTREIQRFAFVAVLDLWSAAPRLPRLPHICRSEESRVGT